MRNFEIEFLSSVLQRTDILLLTLICQIMTYKTNLNELLTIAEIDAKNNSAIFEIDASALTMIWNRGNSMQIKVNKVCYEISKNAVFFLNSFHRVEGVELKSARLLKFSKSFLCSPGLKKPDELRNLCSFTAGELQFVKINETQLDHFESAWSFFCNEIISDDIMQKDMLALLLKRILRFCCKNDNCEKQKKYSSDIISAFNFLVEDHFSEHHDVAFYASKLNKTPKTLSILFSLVMGCPPKDFIHDRIMADARNQIKHTEKSIKEIAYDLGYEDIQTFSRFFKSKEGISPLHYRERLKLEDISNQSQKLSA